jgi:hypothetical protein
MVARARVVGMHGVHDIAKKSAQLPVVDCGSSE